MTDRQEHFDLLQELGGTGELKLGLQGGQGSGKSFTAVEVALGLKRYWELPGPIAMFDTEKGSAFLRERVERETGQKLLGYLGRSRDKLLRWIEQVEKAGISVGIIDSVTHVSDETRDSFVAQRNKRFNRTDRRLGIDEIMLVQEAWKPVVDAIINARVHLICCGRLGFEWGHEDVDGSGNLQLVRTDRKMKAMGGFGYELDLICDLERQTIRVAPGRAPAQGPDRRKKTILSDDSTHRLTVVKDRFDELDGCQVDDPTFEFFRPYVDKLERGADSRVNTELETDHGVDSSGEARWRRQKRDRAILVEKIKEELERCWPGTGKAEKKEKADLAEMFFGTRSWTEISEAMEVDDLQSAWTKLFRYCRGKFPVNLPDADKAAMEQPAAVEETIIKADETKPAEAETPAAEEETPAPSTPSSVERLRALAKGDPVHFLIESGPGSGSGPQKGKVESVDVEKAVAMVIPQGKRKAIEVPLRPSILQAVDEEEKPLL